MRSKSTPVPENTCRAPDGFSMTLSWRSSATLATIQLRARMLQGVRAFFDARGVLEIETPLLSRATVTDVHLDSMRLAQVQPARYLNTSPEYGMKRFVAEHGVSVYQICKAFRQGEAGVQHNPEFSLLEWYRVGFALPQLITEVEQLIVHLHSGAGKPAPALRRVRYGELFMQVTGLNPHHCSIEELAAFCLRHEYVVPQGMTLDSEDGLRGQVERDVWLDWVMSGIVVDSLPSDQLTTIIDYPASQAALAKTGVDADGQHVARRFECYLGKLELANGYDELGNGEEQARRFEVDNAKRRLLGKPPVEPDHRLLQALRHGLPQCCGVALGLDRLLMCLADSDSLGEVLSYDWDRA